jgi:hypothetical protein
VLDEQRTAAIRRLIDRDAEVGRVPECAPKPWWADLPTHLTREGRAEGRDRPVTPIRDAPWRDTTSVERPGWRTRAVYLDGEDEPVTEVDYQTRSTCHVGWVEQPYTPPPTRAPR